MRKIICISGAYSGEDVVGNIQVAKKYAIKLWNMGAAVICPQTNTGFFEHEIGVTTTYEEFGEGYLTMIERADAVFALPNWKKSPGACKEVAFAETLSIPILYRITEVKRFLKSKASSHFEDSIRQQALAQLTEITKKFVLVPRLSGKILKKIR